MAITRYYVTSDAMGSVTGILDEEGTVIERRSYDAFGGINYMLPDGATTTTSPTECDVGFQGQIIDSENNLYQMGFRWYNASLGSWLSRDPIGLAGGFNLYTFVNNSPAIFTDKNGLTCCECPPPEVVTPRNRRRSANWGQFFNGLASLAFGTAVVIATSAAVAGTAGGAAPLAVLSAASAATTITYGIANMVGAFAEDEQAAQTAEKLPSTVPQIIGRLTSGEAGQKTVADFEAVIDLQQAGRKVISGRGLSSAQQREAYLEATRALTESSQSIHETFKEGMEEHEKEKRKQQETSDRCNR
jgi:RHS repeat-associated protein